MDEILTPYDPAETLRSADAVILFLADALETNEAVYLAHAISIAERTAGMAEINRRAGLTTDALCTSLRADPTINSLAALLSSTQRNDKRSAKTA